MVLQGLVKEWATNVMGVDLPVVLCPYLLWSDGSQLTIGDVPFHAVNIMPANWPLQHMRKTKGLQAPGTSASS